MKEARVGWLGSRAASHCLFRRRAGFHEMRLAPFRGNNHYMLVGIMGTGCTVRSSLLVLFGLSPSESRSSPSAAANPIGLKEGVCLPRHPHIKIHLHAQDEDDHLTRQGGMVYEGSSPVRRYSTRSVESRESHLYANALYPTCVVAEAL